MNNRSIQMLQNTFHYVFRRETLLDLLLIALITGLIVELSILPQGASMHELTMAAQMSSIEAISNNPLYLPYKLAGNQLLNFSPSIRIVRVLSFIILLCCTYALYRMLKHWHKTNIAFFTALMFFTNATVLAVGRLGSPLVMLFSWLIIIALLLWLRHGSSRHFAPVGLAVVSTALLYIPGAPYFAILLFALFGSKLKKDLQHIPRKTLALTTLMGLLIIAPLLISAVRDTNVLREWLLLPNDVDLQTTARNILRVPSAFIYRMPVNPLISPGRLPVLDLASGALFLIGLYAYRQNFRLERIRIMFLTAIAAIILGALGQVLAAIIILLPFAYTVIASGAEHLLDEWYRVFPHNPFARSFGLLLLTTVMLLSIYYQLTKFLVVWPHTPQTRTEYSHSRLVQ